MYLTLGFIALSLLLVLWFIKTSAPRFNFKGKTVVITGGSSGIGLAVAQKLAKEGAKLALLARNEQKLKEAKASLGPEASCIIIPTDVADQEQVKKAIAKVTEAYGTLDALVLSAGISRPGMFLEVDMEVHQKIMQVNYFGSLYVIREAVPHMRVAGGGRVALISSMLGMTGLTGYSAYAPSKFALRGLAEGLQMELQPWNIFFTVVNPPDVDTPMLAEENRVKPLETKLISEGTGVFTPEQLADATIEGMVNWQFFVGVGMDGYLQKILCAGMAPACSISQTIVEVLGGGIIRFVSLFYLFSYNRIVYQVRREEDKSK